MRSTEEQLQEILQRSGDIRAAREIRARLRACAAGCASCVVLLAVLFYYLPRVSPAMQEASMQQYGSLLLAAPYMGYVLAGVLSFALGACTVLLCLQWKALKSWERRQR